MITQSYQHVQLQHTYSLSRMSSISNSFSNAWCAIAKGENGAAGGQQEANGAAGGMFHY
jgi:hypothetical protein